jgi:hypothetical protein
MAVPIPNKILTPAILAAGALLIAAAPPNAVAPDGPLVPTRLLQEYVHRTGTLVMAERERLEQVLRERRPLAVAMNARGS